ncbi:tetratricopeptide repeat protein 4 isoform X2 [Nematostella vectensis]|uniref:tetratricopeptide repeat protein 4 isoform X2 n=1 Tax=Nematostella vectensis TaxID=45351 RepID=UPI0013900B78|nr:tetratricopeptide repeat protein 4 isoform X2 [Nematostella vectensis]
MADEKAPKTAEELDQELDNYIDKMIEKNKNYKYKDRLSEETWEEEIENIPLFMTKPPEEGKSISDSIAALQAIKYEDENPVENALSYKEEGNYEYKRKNFKKAIDAYTEGIKLRCQDGHVNAILYTNRATVNFSLGNNRSAWNDAKTARKFEPKYMKAIARGAAATMEMKMYEETIKWCDDGLAIEPDNKTLLKLRTDAASEQKKIERDKRKAKAEKKKEAKEIDAVLKAIEERKINIEKQKSGKNKEDEDEDNVLINKFEALGLQSFHPSGARVQLDENKKLYWPVMFYYPEYKESDFIGAFYEEHCFLDHFKVMFTDEVASWDDEAKYEPYALEVYFDNPSNKHLCFVESSTALKDVLVDPRFLLRQGTPSFIILVKGSSFRDDFLKQYTVEK